LSVSRSSLALRVAVDARKLHDGGIGTYIRGLVGALATSCPRDEWIVLVDPAQQGAMRWPGRVREVAVRAGKYGLAEHFVVPAAARGVHAQLLHAPHYTLPLGWNGPAVVTIHDLIHVRFARFHKPGAGLYARAVAGLAARRATAVIADSEATRHDIVELLGAPVEKVRVVPLGVSPLLKPATAVDIALFRSDHRLPGDYVLYVGARKRHKNLELLVRAWGVMRPGDRPPLVLSGPAWRDDAPLARLAHELGVEESIQFSGDVHDEIALACLYSGAALLVQPSLAEGFGLPPLEAMACGVPVLSSDAGSLPEVLGDAAVYRPPADPAAWAAAVLELLADGERRTALGARGRAHAAGYTWERTAELTRAIYAEAVAERR
jgi:glycosyltransferase involved in cell wall biosynthesis